MVNEEGNKEQGENQHEIQHVCLLSVRVWPGQRMSAAGVRRAAFDLSAIVYRYGDFYT